MTIRLTINGERREVSHTCLADLLSELGYSPESRGVAVAVNRELVPKNGWQGYNLSTGDSVEIVSAVQGG